MKGIAMASGRERLSATYTCNQMPGWCAPTKAPPNEPPLRRTHPGAAMLGSSLATSGGLKSCSSMSAASCKQSAFGSCRAVNAQQQAFGVGQRTWLWLLLAIWRFVCDLPYLHI